MRKATSLPWVMTGQVSVMRQVSFCGTWLATTSATDLVERLGVGKERGGVAVVAQAEQDQVEGGGLGAFELEACCAARRFIAGSGDLGIELTFHAVDVGGGRALLV